MAVVGNIVTISGQCVSMSGHAMWPGAVYTSNRWEEPEPVQPTIEIDKRILDETSQEIGDYERAKITTIDDALNQAKQYRENGHWTELRKVDENTVAVYISKWRRDMEVELGTPKFNGKIVLKKVEINPGDETFDFSNNGFDVELKAFDDLLRIHRLSHKFIEFQIERARMKRALPTFKELYTDLVAMDSNSGGVEYDKQIVEEYQRLTDKINADKIAKAKNI
jgi:hypothetical protein